MYAGIQVLPCLLARFKMWQDSLERRRDAVPPSLHKYALAGLLFKYKATTLPDN